MSYPCQENSLVGVTARRARVTAMRCRRWSCQYCAPRLRRRIVARVLAGFIGDEQVRMITLTAPGDESPFRSYEELAARWNRFVTALRRKHPHMQFEYCKVTEQQQRGHAHLHVLYRGGFIWHGWLKQAAVRAGFGPVRDIRAVGRQVARYVAKYLAKEMEISKRGPGAEPLPKWHRRASWSRGWAPEFAAQRAKWLAQHQTTSYAWYVANGRPVLVAMRLQVLGYEMDDVSYGDVRPRDQAWELDRQLPLRWRSAGQSHQPCWICASGDPASRRPHAGGWAPIPLAPAPAYELWPVG